MKTVRKASVFLMLICLMGSSCGRKTPAEPARIDYSDTTYWYSQGDESHKADVFYVYPTVSTISYTDNGSSWYADITLPEVREEANGNQYVHSKFISERIVLDAVALHKLNGKVMRVGNLAPRSTDGEFQINFQTNSAMGRIRVYQMLGCYPYDLTNAPMEFSPINEVAKAIVLLSETPQECCLFHPFNDHYVHFGDVLEELSKVTKAPRQVEDDVFNEALEAAKQDPEKAKRLSSLIAYQDMAHGQKAVMIPTENKYTSQVLYRLGFRWSSTS